MFYCKTICGLKRAEGEDEDSGVNSKLIPIALLALVSAVSVPAVTLTLNPIADAGIRSQITSNNGTTGEMLVGVVATNDFARAVMSFDLSAIPVDATIDSVSLSLVTTTLDGGSVSQTLTINIQQLTETFTNAGVTWTSRNGTNNWTTFGGTFGGTVLSSYTGNPSTTAGGSTLTFDTSSNFTSAVGAAIGGTFNVIAKLSAEGGSNRGLFRFNTVDATGTANDPVLTINYTVSQVPEPSSYAAFLGSGVVGFAFMRRRRA